MFIKDLQFQVEFSDFAEKHYCKEFRKKYTDRQWAETKKTIIDTLERSYSVQQTNLIDELKCSAENHIGLLKYDFKVAGTNMSPKSSGNRLIFGLCNQTGLIEVLLVYNKGHLEKNKTETQWILEQIKANFPKYKKLC